MAERGDDHAKQAVLSANQGLYDAIEAGDLDLMRSVWAPGDQTVCVHPGSEHVTGTSAIMRSWALVMANTGYIQFILSGVAVTLLPRTAETTGDVEPSLAVVSCTENVLSEAEGESVQTFAGGRAVANNVLVRTPSGWKIWMHHSSPVLLPEEVDEA